MAGAEEQGRAIVDPELDVIKFGDAGNRSNVEDKTDSLLRAGRNSRRSAARNCLCHTWHDSPNHGAVFLYRCVPPVWKHRHIRFPACRNWIDGYSWISSAGSRLPDTNYT